MKNKMQISKEQFLDLYENKKLTTFQIAEKFNCCQATIWKKFKEYNIKPRPAGAKRVKVNLEQLKGLYVDQKLSTWKIEKKLGIPRSTIHRKLKEYGLKIRDRADSHILFPRKNFNGDLNEKAYMIGFRIGDLGVRKIYPNSKTITVASGSTIPEQIKLIKQLFEKYGNIWIKKANNNKINIYVNLNLTFDFLLSKDYPEWVNNKKEHFFAFLAGFTDAEGTISKNKKIDYYALSNCDEKLLNKIKESLINFGIKDIKMYYNKRKGKITFGKYRFNFDYWSLRLFKKKELLKLLILLKPFIQHSNKVKALNISIKSINMRNKQYGK